MDLEEGGVSGASETQMMLMQEEEENLEALRRREEDLGRLCEDITEINIIFQDLASMVHQQGGMVDRIENETEEAHNDIVEANRQLEESERLQRKARKKQILLAIIAIIAIIIFILVIVHEVNGL